MYGGAYFGADHLVWVGTTLATYVLSYILLVLRLKNCQLWGYWQDHIIGFFVVEENHHSESAVKQTDIDWETWNMFLGFGGALGPNPRGRYS